jgi:hypothetical protein
MLSVTTKNDIILGSYVQIERYLEQSWGSVAREGACLLRGLRFPTPFKASILSESPCLQWYEPTVGVDDLRNEEQYRNYVAEKDIEGLEVYRFDFAPYEHHDYQDEVVEAQHAKIVKGFVRNIKLLGSD